MIHDNNYLSHLVFSVFFLFFFSEESIDGFSEHSGASRAHSKSLQLVYPRSTQFRFRGHILHADLIMHYLWSLMSHKLLIFLLLMFCFKNIHQQILSVYFQQIVTHVQRFQLPPPPLSHSMVSRGLIAVPTR